jgi:hypothetical protein
LVRSRFPSRSISSANVLCRWNQAIEQQAFCRVFRIGQLKETKMTRLVIKNTIDQSMMDLKERKRVEIDEVMSSERLKDKLSVQDLMSLFNPVAMDEEGVPFIFADEELGDPSGLNADDEEMGDDP